MGRQLVAHPIIHRETDPNSNGPLDPIHGQAFVQSSKQALCAVDFEQHGRGGEVLW